MASNKKYWKSEAELLPNDPIVETLKQNEFVEHLPVDQFMGDKNTLSETSTNRRDFLKFVGFSTAAASLAACEGPVIKTIPYVIQPEEIVPGVANYYATTIANGFDFASILVKTREGRPIKVENNKEAAVKGVANARVQASVLSLYDASRLQGPLKGSEPISWDDLDIAMITHLEATKGGSKAVVLMTPTYASPSAEELIQDLQDKYPQVKHITYDAVSSDAALHAYQEVYGERALADYDFEKADVIVSFGADFLGDWQGGGYDTGYAKGRIPAEGKMSKHFQVEANMTLSGANADKRILANSSSQKKLVAALYGELSGAAVSASLSNAEQEALNAIAASVKKAGSKAVVVSGLDCNKTQRVVLAINNLLKSEAFDASNPKYIRSSSNKAITKLIEDMNAGMVSALITDGINPSYSLPQAAEFNAALTNVSLSIAYSQLANETVEAFQYAGAASHYLESWGDVQIKKGHYSLQQPAIKELFDTKQFQSSILTWLGKGDTSYFDYIQSNWKASILDGVSFNQALHDGVFVAAKKKASYVDIDALEAANHIAGESAPAMELHLYTSTAMGDGAEFNNPWLQELPDPITRASWDNYALISKADATSLGVVNEHVANGGLDGSYVNLTVDSVRITVPAIIQPGQAPGTIGLALGYGKKAGIKSEMQVGVNAYSLYKGFKNTQNVSIELASGMHQFACVQLQNTLMGRGDIIKETTLEIFNTKEASYWNESPKVSLDHQEVEATSVSLWDDFDRSIGHHFNLSIDLNACTGCGACVIACHAENNVPVVGKEEIRKSRDMHWLRIDRYYSSEEAFEGDNEKKENFSGLFGEEGSLGGFNSMEDPSENPQVAFQPVMCQHCNHAPCETVCPVAATSHSRQGQNHMAYNRCVGTRYCANNCPYKVRRFNWFLYNNNDEFDFHMNNDLGKMVINPDVNVRSRGVMEKCSMCIQKTQKTILDAKRDGRQIKDGEFQTACSAACGNGAMVFGDINDAESKIAALKENDRMYHLLEHVGTKPNVMYQVKVRNTSEA